MSKIVVEYPIPGRLYKHYKGGLYEFMFMSTHSETGEPLVIYRPFYLDPIMQDHYLCGLRKFLDMVRGSKYVKKKNDTDNKTPI